MTCMNYRRISLYLFLLLSASCSTLSAWRWKDPVSGAWEGNWYLTNMPKPGGKLTCTVERTERNQWKAVFVAEFGQTASYKVELLGKREGDKVAFGGDVDLGATSGGVFHWSGQADGEKFTGQYASKFYTGTFEMKRVPAGAHPDASPKPQDPTTPSPAGTQLKS